MLEESPRLNVDIDLTQLRPLKMEELGNYLDQDVFVWNGQPDSVARFAAAKATGQPVQEQWEAAKILWTGNPASRYHTEEVSLKMIRKVLGREAEVMRADVQEELKGILGSIISITPIEGAQAVNIAHDRNAKIVDKVITTIPDHYELVLEGMKGGITLTQRELDFRDVYVRKTA